MLSVMQITLRCKGLSDVDHRHLFAAALASLATNDGCGMEPSIVASFYKLAVAGEQAGFSLEDMTSLLMPD
jgi:hypothetical protein